LFQPQEIIRNGKGHKSLTMKPTVQMKVIQVGTIQVKAIQTVLETQQGTPSRERFDSSVDAVGSKLRSNTFY